MWVGGGQREQCGEEAEAELSQVICLLSQTLF